MAFWECIHRECDLNHLTSTVVSKSGSFVLTILLSCCAVLGAQRFLLPGIYSYVCIVPLVLAIYYFSDKSLRNTLVVFALFISVDNGSDVFVTTAGPVRYLIYLACIYIVFEHIRFSISRTIGVLFLSCIYALQTLLSEIPIDAITLSRDLLLFALICGVVCRSTRSRSFSFDIELLTYLLVVFSLTELANFLLFFSFIEHAYLSYDSVKSLVVLVPFYFIAKRKTLLAIGAVSLVTVVLIAYVTRMIILTYMGTILLFVVIHYGRSFFKMSFIVLLFVLPLLQFISDNQERLKSYKAVAFLSEVQSTKNPMDLFRRLDPVRFEETKLFFSRDWYPLLVGSGFGSGLHDKDDAFNFVSEQQTAFTPQELRSGYFYNLHDTWIDIGLRFGCGFIIWLYGYLVLQTGNQDPYRSMMAMCLLVLVSCASFTNGGLLLTALMFLVMRSPKYNHVKTSKLNDQNRLAYVS